MYYILHLNLNFLRHYVVRWRLKCLVKLLVSINWSYSGEKYQACKLEIMSLNTLGASIHVYLIKFGLPLDLTSSYARPFKGFWVANRLADKHLSLAVFMAEFAIWQGFSDL